MKQQSFFRNSKRYFGGSTNIGKRKEQRALSCKKPMHLILKSQKHINLFKAKKKIINLIYRQAKTKGLKIYRLSVQKDHVHIALKIHNRYLYKGFIRAITGLLARKYGKGLWVQLPFTRIVEFGRDFKNLLL